MKIINTRSNEYIKLFCLQKLFRVIYSGCLYNPRFDSFLNNTAFALTKLIKITITKPL